MDKSFKTQKSDPTISYSIDWAGRHDNPRKEDTNRENWHNLNYV